MTGFAPTPMHGAAYAVAIETVGGQFEIGDCNTRERYDAIKAKLGRLRQWAQAQPSPEVKEAYRWGCDKVQADAHARFRVHENSRAVREAYASIPRPPK